MKVNLNQMASEVFGSGKRFFLNIINDYASRKFQKAKLALIQDVATHPVSIEINGGIDAANISHTLSGRKGNLFSFLGFRAGTKPVDDLLFLINQTVKFIPATKISVFGLSEVNFTYPSRGDFLQLPLPWEPGRSWVTAIEDGVSNLSYYIFKESESSRSGRGIQIDNVVRPIGFSLTPYMSPILEKFKLALNG